MKQVYIFGDSFTGMFSLLKAKNINLKRISGASIQGLIKEDNLNRLEIIKTLNNQKSGCAIFSFGQVDLYFVYYYKLIIKSEKYDIDNAIHLYIKFIHDLKYFGNKIVFAVYPSYISAKNFFLRLFYYKVLDGDTIKKIPIKLKSELSNEKNRYKLFKLFNSTLERYCKIYNITFINLEKQLMTKGKIKKKYIDKVSILNVHLLWEPLLPMVVESLNCCGLEKKYNVDLKKSLTNYFTHKKDLLEKKLSKQK